jgi:hypothetical protein
MKRLHMSSWSWLFSSTKRIVGPRRRPRDPLGVAIVVLLRLDVGSNIFRRHQPDVVAVAGENTANVMGAAARLHPDYSGRQLLREPDQRLASHPAPHDNRAGRVKPDHAADVLAKINTENSDIRHSPSSS